MLARQLCTASLALGIGHGFVSTGEHLAHGGIVVAAGDAFDVEAAVVAALHFVMMKHHARCLGVLSTSVRDVKAFDGEIVQIVSGQIQRVGQGPGACLLRAFFGQQARQLNIGVFLGHFQPDAPLLTRLLNNGDAHTGLLRQQLNQLFIHRMTDDQRRRHRHTDIVLGDKRIQHQNLNRFFAARSIHLLFRKIDRACITQIRREIRPVTQMAPAAHHGQIHTGTATQHLDGQNINILIVRRLNGLLMQHARQGRNLVAHLGGLFKLQLFRIGHHAGLKLLQQFLRLAAQHGLGIAHIQGIGFGRDHVHARPGATLDLIEQTRA